MWVCFWTWFYFSHILQILKLTVCYAKCVYVVFCVLTNAYCCWRRSLQNSPLCWLTWHNELEAAAFLVNAGWELSEERWISLPGKNPAMEQFLTHLRQIVREPLRLTCVCRRVIRQHISQACDDRDVVLRVERLPIPLAIKRFLTFENEEDVLWETVDNHLLNRHFPLSVLRNRFVWIVLFGECLKYWNTVFTCVNSYSTFSFSC